MLNKRSFFDHVDFKACVRHAGEMFSRLESLAYRWYLEPYVFVRSPSKLCVLEGGGNEDIWQE